MVRHAMRMMVGTFASRILGLLREVMTAAFFGATRQLDAFNVAYTMANLLRQLLAEGALSASFVPVFSRLFAKEGKDAARSLARQVLAVLLVLGTVAVLAGIAFSPLLVRLIAPGFQMEERLLAIGLTRFMFPFLLLVSVGALAMGALNSMGSFFVPAIAPAASNLAYILYLVAARGHLTIWDLPVAVLIGGSCHMLIQWYWAARMDVLLVPEIPDLKNPELRQTLGLFLPYAAGLSLTQVNPLISRMLGSFLEGGTISVMNYADRVIQLPQGLFVIAISQAVLPLLSRLDKENVHEFRDFIRDALRFNLFVVLPISVGLLLISSPVVHLLFVRGAFGEWAWGATAKVLAIYGLGLPGIACNTVLMRSLYARNLPKAAVSVTVVTVSLNLIASVVLMRFFSYLGLAMATSIAFSGAALFSSTRLTANLGCPLNLLDRRWIAKLGLSCAAMGGALWFATDLFPYDPSASLRVRALWLLVMTLGSVVIYTASTKMLRCSEWNWIKEALSRKKAMKQGEINPKEGE